MTFAIEMRGRAPPHLPYQTRLLANSSRSPARPVLLSPTSDFPTQMPLSSDAESKIMTTTGLFVIVFFGTAFYYPLPSILACLVMLLFVSILLRALGSNRRR